MYERIVSADGRRDLAIEFGRAQFVKSMLLRMLFRPAEALSALRRSIEIYALVPEVNRPPQFAQVVDLTHKRIEVLEKMLTAPHVYIDELVADAQGTIKMATWMSQNGDSAGACDLFDDALVMVVDLERLTQLPGLLELAAHVCASKGVVGMHAGRMKAAEYAMTLSIQFYERLVLRNPEQFLERWVRTNLGPAALCLLQEQEQQADAVMLQMKRRLKELAPSDYARWSAFADQSFDGMKRSILSDRRDEMSR
jgi:hypothetical protein